MKESRRILLRMDVEKIKNITRKLLTRAQIARTDAPPTPNQKEKLDGCKIRTTAVSRTVREIPFGIDKTDGSHAQLTRKEKMRFARYRGGARIYGRNNLKQTIISQWPENLRFFFYLSSTGTIPVLYRIVRSVPVLYHSVPYRTTESPNGTVLYHNPCKI